MELGEPIQRKDTIEYKKLLDLKKELLSLIENNFPEMTVKYSDQEPRRLFIIDDNAVRSGFPEYLRSIFNRLGFKNYHIVIGDDRHQYDTPLRKTVGNIYAFAYEKQVEFE